MEPCQPAGTGTGPEVPSEPSRPPIRGRRLAPATRAASARPGSRGGRGRSRAPGRPDPPGLGAAGGGYLSLGVAHGGLEFNPPLRSSELGPQLGHLGADSARLTRGAMKRWVTTPPKIAAASSPLRGRLHETKVYRFMPANHSTIARIFDTNSARRFGLFAMCVKYGVIW